jgi:hypothetical protein
VACIGGREMRLGFWWGNMKTSLGRPKRRWNNIKAVFREIVVVWIGVGFLSSGT